MILPDFCYNKVNTKTKNLNMIKMSTFTIWILLSLSIVFIFSWWISEVFSAEEPATTNQQENSSSYRCWWKNASDCSYQLNDIFGGEKWPSKDNKLEDIVSKVIRFIAVSASWVAVLCIIIWGYMVMIPSDEKRAATWKTLIVHTIIWIMIVYWAYAIITVVQSVIYSF